MQMQNTNNTGGARGSVGTASAAKGFIGYYDPGNDESQYNNARARSHSPVASARCGSTSTGGRQARSSCAKRKVPHMMHGFACEIDFRNEDSDSEELYNDLGEGEVERLIRR